MSEHPKGDFKIEILKLKKFTTTENKPKTSVKRDQKMFHHVTKLFFV